jgi:hypothetical protein
VAGRRAVPLLLLAAAVVCVLVALRVLPYISLPADVGQPAAVIANDTTAPVVVSRCSTACVAGSARVTLRPGQDLRAGPPGTTTWLVEDERGRRVGCLMAMTSGERLLVSRAGPCPP